MFKYIKTEEDLILKFNNIINPNQKSIYGVAHNHEWDFYYKKESPIKINLTIKESLLNSKESYLTSIIELKYLEDLNLVSIDLDNPFITFLLYANNFNFLISSPRFGHSNIILKTNKNFDEGFIKQKYITATSKIKVLDKFFLPDTKNTHRFFISLGEELSTFLNFKNVIEIYQSEIEKYWNVFELDFENIEKYKIL
jgi:hypothetical protein